ncbi:hypothetical protein EYF80_019317 [Liparis tanakae]|uniref:Uncharacterized protein n=1 Tax=Liparis tanakae TaxID=230148 RepID=A0A4Z2HY31_9TELE|nr:hypothetical protein EYF80_019317 [Liparis tanakae]
MWQTQKSSAAGQPEPSGQEHGKLEEVLVSTLFLLAARELKVSPFSQRELPVNTHLHICFHQGEEERHKLRQQHQRSSTLAGSATRISYGKARSGPDIDKAGTGFSALYNSNFLLPRPELSELECRGLLPGC